LEGTRGNYNISDESAATRDSKYLAPVIGLRTSLGRAGSSFADGLDSDGSVLRIADEISCFFASPQDSGAQRPNFRPQAIDSFGPEGRLDGPAARWQLCPQNHRFLRAELGGPSRQWVVAACLSFGATGRGSVDDGVPAIIKKEQCCTLAMQPKNSNSHALNFHLPACCRHSLASLGLSCPRRYRANLPSRLRPSLFGSD
jgi:hypothetical protein